MYIYIFFFKFYFIQTLQSIALNRPLRYLCTALVMGL